ncbi:hypothetical protein MA16_Dca023682 [Dendrobium catenatum]|uniref:Uncharacterized protein n=1 Tax=Dendrobium catenatum TaxID=906689 RepID=A0A2I0V7A1_9ASPA|nr:hypothetical protein MA16_Dca023682 [Dendrobium catenatum]
MEADVRCSSTDNLGQKMDSSASLLEFENGKAISGQSISRKVMDVEEARRRRTKGFLVINDQVGIVSQNFQHCIGKGKSIELISVMKTLETLRKIEANEVFHDRGTSSLGMNIFVQGFEKVETHAVNNKEALETKQHNVKEQVENSLVTIKMSSGKTKLAKEMKMLGPIKGKHRTRKETKKENLGCNDVRRMVGSEWDFHHVAASGKSRGILILWKHRIASFKLWEHVVFAFVTAMSLECDVVPQHFVGILEGFWFCFTRGSLFALGKLCIGVVFNAGFLVVGLLRRILELVFVFLTCGSLTEERVDPFNLALITEGKYDVNVREEDVDGITKKNDELSYSSISTVGDKRNSQDNESLSLSSPSFLLKSFLPQIVSRWSDTNSFGLKKYRPGRSVDGYLNEDAITRVSDFRQIVQADLTIVLADVSKNRNHIGSKRISIKL